MTQRNTRGIYSVHFIYLLFFIWRVLTDTPLVPIYLNYKKKKKKVQPQWKACFFTAGDRESCVSPLRLWNRVISDYDCIFQPRSERMREASGGRELAKRSLRHGLWPDRVDVPVHNLGFTGEALENDVQGVTKFFVVHGHFFDDVNHTRSTLLAIFNPFVALTTAPRSASKRGRCRRNHGHGENSSWTGPALSTRWSRYVAQCNVFVASQGQYLQN